jgi:hypothetical protein
MNTFRLARYRFTLQPREPLHLPRFAGSTLRGAFGAVFRQVSCVADRGEECRHCILKDRCAYSYVFETGPPPGAQKLRTYQNVPRPFVLEPPLDRRTEYAVGEPFVFNLVLIGRALDFLPYFVYAFIELQERGLGPGRGRYDLAKVEAYLPAPFLFGEGLPTSPPPPTDRSPGSFGEGLPTSPPPPTEGSPLSGAGPRTPLSPGEALPSPLLILHTSYPVYQNGELHDLDATITGEHLTAYAATLPTDELTVHFETPTRIQYQGDFLETPHFHHLIRSLLHRLSSLCTFHCGSDLDVDFRGLIAAAEQVEHLRPRTRWVEQTRYSRRQDTEMQMGGFIGPITYRGDLTPFLWLLAAGELAHTGKGTVMGLGKYRLGG